MGDSKTVLDQGPPRHHATDARSHHDQAPPDTRAADSKPGSEQPEKETTERLLILVQSQLGGLTSQVSKLQEEVSSQRKVLFHTLTDMRQWAVDAMKDVLLREVVLHLQDSSASSTDPVQRRPTI